MPLITEINIHYRLADGMPRVHTLIPESQDIAVMKRQIGIVLADIRDNQIGVAGDKQPYYYVVLKARKYDGSTGYRTQIPKTLF